MTQSARMTGYKIAFGMESAFINNRMLLTISRSIKKLQTKYAPKIITVTVADEAVELGNAKLWLYGDVNYDGVTDSKDATQITRYANLKTSIFTTGDEATKADRLIAADVTGDGAVDSKDATQVTRYANIKTSIFDKLK